MFKFIIGFVLGFYVAMYGVSAVLDKIADTITSAKEYIEQHEKTDTADKPDLIV